MRVGQSSEPQPGVTKLRVLFAAVLAGLIAISAVAVYLGLRLKDERQAARLFYSQWTPDIAALWRPFIGTDRPVLISIGTPLLIELPGWGYFRDPSVNTPDAIPQSKALAMLQQTLHVSNVRSMNGYASLGAAQAAFTLGRILGVRKDNVSTIDGSALSWVQMSKNDVVLIGRPRFFRLQLAALPVHPELEIDEAVGVRNLHPKAGEPSVFVNERSGSTGITYAVASLSPGPDGSTNVIEFFARDGAGMTGAIGWFTDPVLARDLVTKLRAHSGHLPRYYQVLFKVRFQDRVPLETSYVLHRELRAVGR